ncbi:MAG: tetratricopeptide repeat protein [Thermomicrobiales bacterium]
MEVQPALEVRLLGGFQVIVAGQSVPEHAWRRKRAAAVVKLLALAPAHRLHRDEIIESLWPDLDPDAAANNLRVALHHARRILTAGDAAVAFLPRVGDIILLAPDTVIRSDVARFETAVRQAWQSPEPAFTRAALDLYTGDLLPDDRYEDWVEERRAALRTSFLTLLRRVAQLHEQRGEFGAAIAALQQAVASEPVDEDAHVALIRLFAQEGEIHRALNQFDRLTVILASELAAEPQAATTDLIAAIREGRFQSEVAAPIWQGAPVAAFHGQPLPVPPTNLIGREREVAEVVRLLATNRLVTVTGPGGVGKSRLALAVAHHFAAPDGASFADLAPLDAPQLVLPLIARALGVEERAGQPLLEAMAEQIQGRRLLLIENMEHVASAAPLIPDILAACPGLTMLVTSRSRMKLRGEQEYLVQPLALPEWRGTEQRDLPAALPATSFADAPAVALFALRAKEAWADFALTVANAGDIAAICHRLDGLPLAIELAAARVRLLPPAEILARLDRPLTLLTGGPRDAPDRHRTLRATIAWSHDLLTPEEQDLFAWLSVFAGGFNLAAVERISDHHVAFRSAPLDLVSSLVDQSLVHRTGGRDDPARLGMLATIREYARERLDFGGEADTVRRRHAHLFLDVALEAAPELSGSEQGAWLERLEREQDNLRAALQALRELGETNDALRLAASLWRFWWQRGYLTEGRFWLEETLADGEDADAVTRADAHDGAGALAEAQGDLAAAALHHEKALGLRRQLGDRRGEARSLIDFGIIADKMGDPVRAVSLYQQALALARDADDRPRLAACLANLGFVFLDRGDHHQAAVAFQESSDLFRELDDQRNLSYVLGGLGNLAFLAGDFAGAVAIQQESLRVLRELDDRQGIADAVADLGHAVQRQGDLDRAGALFGEALQRYRDLGDRSGMAFALIHLGRLSRLQGDLNGAEHLLRDGLRLGQQIGEVPMVTEGIEGLAEVACARQDARRCARLLGVAEAMRETTDIPLPAIHASAMAECETAARAALGASGFATAHGEGRALSAEHALAELLPIEGG